MVEHKYGIFTDEQMNETRANLRKRVFFLLLIVDPKTKHNYDDYNVDVPKSFQSVLREIGGLNDLFGNPQFLVAALSLLDAALLEYQKSDFDFSVYRRLVLEAGAKFKEGV